MSDSLKTRLARGDQVVIFGIGRLFHHNLIQLLGLQGGFDGFWIDHEHVGLTIRDIEIAAVTGRSVGLDCFVRMAPTDYALVTRCLETGAGGVMAAQIHSAEQAEQFVRWAKFVPRGQRGLNIGGYDAGFGSRPAAEFIAAANRDTLVAIQIETLGALQQCDTIAAIDGVDHLFVGPADLSQSLGVTGEFMHPKCIEALDRVSAACRNHGKTWGAVTPTPAHAEMLVEKGCTLLSPVNDVRLAQAGLKALQVEFSGMFPNHDRW